ncbi:MAG TPA: hypothetical protein VGP64_09515 [Polyangia bacterium]|jgi:hypothetical protein
MLLVAQAVAPVDAGAGPATPRSSLLAPIGSKPTALPARDYELRRGPGGDLVYEAAGFTARIARDGSVRFHDKHLTLSLLPLIPHARGPRGPITSVPSLESVIRGHGKVPPPPPPDAVEASSTAYGARLPAPTVTPYRPDPREACSYPAPCFFGAAVVFVSVNGEFDVTDELMRLASQDPYRFAKARFLAGTRDLRVRLAARAHADDVRRSIADLPARLALVACDGERSVAERRAILEALRAELDPGSPEGREAGSTIDRFLAGLDGPDGGLACPSR